MCEHKEAHGRPTIDQVMYWSFDSLIVRLVQICIRVGLDVSDTLLLDFNA